MRINSKAVDLENPPIGATLDLEQGNACQTGRMVPKVGAFRHQGTPAQRGKP
jgi:hypothetical protein